MAGSGWNGVTTSWQRAGIRAAKLALGLVIVLLIGLLAGEAQEVAALSLKGWGHPGRQVVAPPGARTAMVLQEVAPPPAVLQLRQALAARKPRVAIEAPAAGGLLPEGPWVLRLRAEDWPLVDAGSLGLGPHLVVQLDDEAPRRLTTTEVTMPPLTPGSHRLTVYAAWPWGEAVKDPGAWRQIRIHRVAANPLSLPSPGSPQLLGVSPSEPAAVEPVLVDWLLIDTPLQNLRADDASWRLRISVNGDSFLVDRQTPLWLKGWRAGSNALQLELVDPRGEPLNPPFNSLVREVRLGADAIRPPWLGSQLAASELARLLGEAPPDREPEPEQERAKDAEPATGEPEGKAAAPGVQGLPPAGPAPITDLQEDTVGPDDPPEATAAPSPATRPPDPTQPASDAAQEVPVPEQSLEIQATRLTQQQEESLQLEKVLPAEANRQPVPPQSQEKEAEAASPAPAPGPAREFEASEIPLGSPGQELTDEGTVIPSESPGPLARLRRRLGR